MERQTLVVLTILFSVLLLMVQRADPIKKQAVRGFVWFSTMLIAIYVWWNGYWLEFGVGFILATVFNALFWVLIGRYNPPGSSDDIRVLGMDD